MDLAADLAALSPRHGGYPCAITLALNEMGEDDRAVLLAALDNRRLQAPGISRVLRAHGYEVGEGAIRRHRRKDCSCP